MLPRKISRKEGAQKAQKEGQVLGLRGVLDCRFGGGVGVMKRYSMPPRGRAQMRPFWDRCGSPVSAVILSGRGKSAMQGEGKGR